MRFSTLRNFIIVAGVAFGNTLAAQNVGVGIATPAAKLEVDGGFAVTPATLAAAANITVPTNETVLRILDDGANVAIAVAPPPPLPKASSSASATKTPPTRPPSSALRYQPGKWPTLCS